MKKKDRCSKRSTVIALVAAFDEILVDAFRNSDDGSASDS